MMSKGVAMMSGKGSESTKARLRDNGCKAMPKGEGGVGYVHELPSCSDVLSKDGRKAKDRRASKCSDRQRLETRGF